MNIPYKSALHLDKLKATGARLTKADAWGNSPNNANYASFDVYGLAGAKFTRVCAELGLHWEWYGVAGYSPNKGSTMVVAKYIKDVPTT